MDGLTAAVQQLPPVVMKQLKNPGPVDDTEGAL